MTDAFSVALPKSPAKRAARLRSLHDGQIAQLEKDRLRYQELIDRGADALSQYDREISHGGNLELAIASAIALTYNHIRFGLGRLAWLEQRLEESSPKGVRKEKAE